jgi:hypothetical protein
MPLSYSGSASNGLTLCMRIPLWLDDEDAVGGWDIQA